MIFEFKFLSRNNSKKATVDTLKYDKQNTYHSTELIPYCKDQR